jgi:hypothetical protein
MCAAQQFRLFPTQPPRHEASHLAGPVAFALSCDLHEGLRARAIAECVSVSPVLRRFVLAYVRQAAIGRPDIQAG